MIEKALAQILPPINPGDLGGQQFSNPFQIVLFALNYFVLPILAGLSVMFIVWSGYQFLTSSGDPARAQKARANLAYSITGVILTALAFGLIRVLNSIVQQAAP